MTNERKRPVATLSSSEFLICLLCRERFFSFLRTISSVFRKNILTLQLLSGDCVYINNLNTNAYVSVSKFSKVFP